MKLQIDDAFIKTWEPRYDRVASDEPAYKRLVGLVHEEMQSSGVMSKETFLAIWRWKGAMRVIRHTTIYVPGYATKAAEPSQDQYESRYAAAFRRAAAAPPGRKLGVLLGGSHKLPGVEAPTGTTLLHFMHPDSMPIIDVRTAEVLVEAGLIRTADRDLDHYEVFRNAIEGIRQRCPGWSLRQIDRALFAYHSLTRSPGAVHCA
jgi:hypothetical protein